MFTSARWGRRFRLPPVFIAAWLSLTLQAQNSYVGSPTCSKCHPDRAASQLRSPHAAALSRTSAHALAVAFPLDRKLVRQPGYRFDFFRSGGTFTARMTNARDVMELPMEWAFGAG